ncbi:MAG: hypothetical protein KAH54_06020 [Candidatus Sabulitectum sp.]|nr:hypothetical protein [Candidatus Sabulitectum sp.]
MIAKVLFVLAISVALISGCGSDTSGENAVEAVDNTVDEQAAVNNEVVPEAEVSRIEASVTLESTNGAYTAADPIDWSVVGTQQVEVSSFDDTAFYINIANFETTENLRTVELEPGQAVLKLVVKQPEGEKPMAGVCDLTKVDVEFSGTLSIKITGGTTVSLSQSAMTAGELLIESVTADHVTGSFSVEERWTIASGVFQAEFI